MAQQAAHQQKRGPSASRMRWPELSKPRTKAAQAAIAGNGDNKIEAAAAVGSSVNASKPSDSLQL